MAIVNNWITWAERVDGHPAKIYTQPNSGKWITVHSIVGNLPNHTIPPRFLSNNRKSDGTFTDDAAASVMFILYRDGHLIQMYPITASTWTSSTREANTNSWAIEAEGGYPNNKEKLTAAASKTFVKLVREWEAWSGQKAISGVTLKQHKDFVQTECASDRYSDAWAATQEKEDEMTPEQFQEQFLLNMGKFFPAYIKAYYEKGFTVANGIVDPGEVTDDGPVKPWLNDMKNR